MERKSSPKTVWDYLKPIKERGIEPNFWTSNDYLLWSGAKIKSEDNWIWPELDGFCLLPPMRLNYNLSWTPPPIGDLVVWSDFYGEFGSIERIDELDWEYIYNPKNFLEMEGKSWKTFRKNVKKFPDRTSLPINYRRIQSDEVELSIDLLGGWSEERGGAESIQDLETIVVYIEKTALKFGLWLGNEMVGFNIWDHNWEYINYRYSFYNPNIDFLSEYLRYRFFTDPKILKFNKWINDGGTLDNPGLEFFKDRLQPARKRKVYSWRIKKYENQDRRVKANI